MEETGFQKWFEDQLCLVTGLGRSDPLVIFLKSLKNYEERNDYLKSVLNIKDQKHADFYDEYLKRVGRSKGPEEAPTSMTEYRKSKEEPIFFAGSKRQDLGSSKASSDLPRTRKHDGPAKKSFIKAPAEGGHSRQVCECQASKHSLVNNCLGCGRVVCEREGSGPCLLCHQLVCTKDELEVLNRGSKKSAALRDKLMAKGGKEEEEDRKIAEAKKDRLMEYDRTSEARTRVIDDESDYFSVDSYKWMTLKQRREMEMRQKAYEEQKHGSRLDRVIDLDFAGRQVLEVKRCAVPQEIMSSAAFASEGNEFHRCPINPFLDGMVPELSDEPLMLSDEPNHFKGKSVIQDRELQEMSDQGLCLSMHQPYASLLIRGIKIHEGRSWYSSHRGRLWIHSASKEATDADIKTVEAFYQNRAQGPLKFPSSYPASCLLGCVCVDEVLAQEEYQESYQDGESESPFVFICSNPLELPVKFPMSGKHKIYKLDPNVHKAANGALRR